MKRIILVTIVMLASIGAFAQTNKGDLAIIRAYFQKDKADLIKESLKLSESQSRGFWAIYDVYEAKRVKLADKRIAIITDYLKQFETLTGRESTTLIYRTLDNDKALTDLRRLFVKQFADVIGGKNTAKFYQLENYEEEIVRMKVQDDLPFIGELKNSQ